MADPAHSGRGRDIPPDAGDQNRLNEHVRTTGNAGSGRRQGLINAAGVLALFALAGFVLWSAPDGDQINASGSINIEATVMDNVQGPVPAAPGY